MTRNAVGVSTCGKAFHPSPESRYAAGKGAGVGERYPRQKEWQGQRGRGKRAEQAQEVWACAFHPPIAPLCRMWLEMPSCLSHPRKGHPT